MRWNIHSAITIFFAGEQTIRLCAADADIFPLINSQNVRFLLQKAVDAAYIGQTHSLLPGYSLIIAPAIRATCAVFATVSTTMQAKKIFFDFTTSPSVLWRTTNASMSAR